MSRIRLDATSGAELTAALAVSVTAAFLVSVNLMAALAFVVALGVLGGLAAVRASPASRLLVFSVLLLSATVDLVGHLQLGPTTAYAWVTGLVAVAAVFVSLLAPARTLSPAARRVLGYMTLLPAWALLSVVWAPMSLASAQNVLVYVAFPALVTVAALASASAVITFSALRRLMLATLLIGSAFYAATLAIDGFGGSAVVSARAYALFAAVGVGWCVALARFGYRTELKVALLLSSLVFLSLSRTAFVASLALLMFGLLGARTTSELRRSIAVVGGIAVVAVSVYSISNPFSERFSQGDLVAVRGGLAVNAMGRSELWRATWDAALRHPVVGGGVGSAEAVVRTASPSDDNPHNDFLRVFHDLGLVGFVLLGLALLVPAASCAAACRASPRTDREPKSLHLAAVLMLVALALGMTTDNPLVYLFVLAPVAVVVGSSLGLRVPPRAYVTRTGGA